MKKIIFATIAMTLLAATILASSSYGQSASAQIVKKDNGASSLAPGQEAKIPVPQPPIPVPKDFAPGQEAEQHCIGCVKELTPGQEGLAAGIIGPIKK